VIFDPNRPVAPDPFVALPPVPAFVLTSDDMRDGEPLRRAQTAAGGSVSPSLSWSAFPEATRSFLLTCYDADAPHAGGVWHWVVGDIPASVTSVPTGNRRSIARALVSVVVRPASSIGEPEAVDLPSTMRATGFLGASPPKGDRAHRYFFAVHALDVARLALPRGRTTPPALVAAAALPHTLARAVLMATHQR